MQLRVVPLHRLIVFLVLHLEVGSLCCQTRFLQIKRMHQLLEHDNLVLDACLLFLDLICGVVDIFDFSENLIPEQIPILEFFFSEFVRPFDFFFLFILFFVQFHNSCIQPFYFISLGLDDILVLLLQHFIIHLRVADITHPMLLLVRLRENSFVFRAMPTHRPRTPFAMPDRMLSHKVTEGDVADHALFGVFEPLVLHPLSIKLSG